MALTASEITDTARVILLDPNAVTWTDDELVDYLAKAIRATCLIKIDAYSITAYRTLAAGSLQTLPEGAIQLLDVTHNQVSGQSIRKVSRRQMDSIQPGWFGDPPFSDAVHYIAEADKPLNYWVWPPSDGTQSVEEVYGAVPTIVAALTDPIIIDDAYEPALLAYVLSMAYSKNSKRNDIAKAEGYMTKWESLVGLRTKSQHQDIAGGAHK